MTAPAIVLVSEEHADVLLDEFGRYTRDDDLRVARSCEDALQVSEELRAGRGTVARKPGHHRPRRPRSCTSARAR